MKPPLPHSESAVPRTLHAQLEIAKAIRTLMVPDDDEPLRRRRAELAAMRGELEAMKRDLHKAGAECLALVKAELRAALAKKYNPDQPRVSAGNRDGGQWTSGAKAGSESPSASTPSPGRRDDASRRSTQTRATPRYAQDVPAVTDAGVNSSAWDKISASSIPANDPKHPEPFVDSDGSQIFSPDGRPLLRPDDSSPEEVVREGLTYDFKGKFANALQAVAEHAFAEQEHAQQDLAVALWQTLRDLAVQLSKFKQGGPWDAERIPSIHAYVEDYHDYANILIGLYMAATGVQLSDGLLIADTYARMYSRFQGPKDKIYTHSLQRDVIDIKIGYDLYRSGRIRP